MIKNQLIFIYLTLILAFIFYWFELRPISIRKKCEFESQNKGTISKFAINNYYRQCLIKNGMPPESMFVNLE